MFQYVSIISVSTIPSRILFPRFTFQYVSIISLLSPRHSFLPEAHLHSNMFLLFLYISERLILCVQNLHSNMFLLFRLELLLKAGVIKIYIPICFYYFAVAYLTIVAGIIFTFQYVSIISMELTWISVRHRFIYIPICFYYFRYKFWASKCSKGNLHSNMFLLFLLAHLSR